MESLLFFREDETAADTGAIMPASAFLGMGLVDANTVQLDFKATSGAAKITSVRFDFSGQFKEACRAIAGALNSNTMTIVADEVDGVYLSYPGGTFSGEVVVDDES